MPKFVATRTAAFCGEQALRIEPTEALKGVIETAPTSPAAYPGGLFLPGAVDSG